MDEQVVKAQSSDFGDLAAMKESLGEILLALQCPLTAKEQQELWQCFESLIAQYAEQKIKEKGR
jgi:hypothetical protein